MRLHPRVRPGFPYLAGGPLLIAHRGGAKLAPENTMLAFRRAIDWWHADILELDVQPTRDGEVVVFHDPVVDRTTERTGAISALSLKEIRELDGGYRFTPDGGKTFPFRGRGVGISTLAEVLAEFPGGRINIEIKDGRAQERVWESVRESKAFDRVLFAAGSAKNRSRLNGYPVPVSGGKEELRLFVGQLAVGLSIYTPGVDAFQIPDNWEGREVASPRLFEAARKRNIAVHVWTIDEETDMTRLLDWGADGIVTDRPDRLARLLHRRLGRPLPPGPGEGPIEPFLEPLLSDY